MSPSKWHRRVSPLFMLLLIVAGIAIAFVAYVAFTAVLGPRG